VRARAAFEAEQKSRHTKVEYQRVMDRFRAIYHDDPSAAHAPSAVEQVAEMLAEEGHEFDDRKALKDAAGQYAFLAKAYPGYRAGKREEAVEVGKSAAATAAVPVRSVQAPNTGVSPLRPTMKPSSSGRDDSSLGKAGASSGRDDGLGGVAIVSAIRHWSTGTYTRVAIDLGPDAGDDVAYQAVRVEHPDRIFFDLRHVKLAPELAGKTFNVTDGGFLSSIRAAQMQGDKTRVVLDVQDVSEYSAFLLPNPERLIIDIHGRAVSKEQGVRNREDLPVASSAPVEISSASEVRETPRTNGSVEVSTLPPMPVTDGSAGFGLTPRAAAPTWTVKTATPQPRVVIPTKPTVAKPVPNTVTNNTGQSGDVAAVSDQPGKVSATSRPTSMPVSSGSGGDHYRSLRGATADRPSATRSQLSATSSSAASLPVAVQPVTSEGDATLMRALGLKIGRIVIDAGHGGHDSGTLGAGGIQEKDVVLDVALRLGKLLHDRLGAEIVYTRADDTFIPLETRTAIANKAQADLFISVHANSSQDASARGVEVYYLNFTSDPDAMKVASRENAVSTQSVHELSDLVKKIALKDKIDESRELAADVDASLYGGLSKGNAGLKDRGVKKAPFVVLIGANMPSILAEISFVTNPDDAEQLQTETYRERVAESLYKGVAKYAAGINGSTRPTKAKAPGLERAER
jgi:N-acetylmuramoyl-L-alanine amidase